MTCSFFTSLFCQHIQNSVCYLLNKVNSVLSCSKWVHWSLTDLSQKLVTINLPPAHKVLSSQLLLNLSTHLTYTQLSFRSPSSPRTLQSLHAWLPLIHYPLSCNLSKMQNGMFIILLKAFQWVPLILSVVFKFIHMAFKLWSVWATIYFWFISHHRSLQF